MVILNTLECNNLNESLDGTSVKVANLMLMLLQPGTAKGVGCTNVGDENGNANLILFLNVVMQDSRDKV
jgi:hypothetical protein